MFNLDILKIPISVNTKCCRCPTSMNFTTSNLVCRKYDLTYCLNCQISDLNSACFTIHIISSFLKFFFHCSDFLVSSCLEGWKPSVSIILVGFAIPPATQKFAEVRAGETAAYSALWFRSASPLRQLLAWSSACWLFSQTSHSPPLSSLATYFLDVP